MTATQRRTSTNVARPTGSETIGVDAAVETIIEEAGLLDAIIHNAGHMVNGPTEAFMPEEIARVYDTNVFGTQRLNRAALPHLRQGGHGLVLWVGSSSTKGGTPPYLAYDRHTGSPLLLVQQSSLRICKPGWRLS